jgi:hypothetical protein
MVGIFFTFFLPPPVVPILFPRAFNIVAREIFLVLIKANLYDYRDKDQRPPQLLQSGSLSIIETSVIRWVWGG